MRRSGSRQTKPVFQNVVDLGLRDVGIENQPRRLAAQFGKLSVLGVGLAVVTVFVACVFLRRLGADPALLMAFFLVSIGGFFAFAVRTAKKSPPVVVRVNAEGKNQAVWIHLVSSLALLPVALTLDSLLVVPVLLLAFVMTALVWRSRGRVPQVLGRLRTELEPGETVIGDGVGVAQGVRRDGLRLIVCTDRRVLVATTSPAVEWSLLIDAPYEDVSRFAIEWKMMGRLGTLSLTVAGPVGTPAQTHVIGSVAPLNLLSIAQALHSHGVCPDEPESVDEAQRAWQDAQRSTARETPLLDRGAMSTRQFDRGLWLLLALSAVTFYLELLGAGVAGLLIFAAGSALAGYVSGTRSSLTYLLPLNLLVSPAFLFMDASQVFALMLLLSSVASLFLWVGSKLRGATADPTVQATPGSAARAPRGSLRYALSAPGLIRLSGMMLAATLAMVTIAGVLGYQVSTVGLALNQATAKQLPVDGRSDLSGNAASITYTRGPDLHELVTDEEPLTGPYDGARWELRSSATTGHNVVSLAHYIFEPRLDDTSAVADFVAGKDREHTRLAGFEVGHTERVIAGRKGYVWDHGSRNDFWYYVVWFPQPVHSVRVECIARTQKDRFKRLCDEALASLEFH